MSNLQRTQGGLNRDEGGRESSEKKPTWRHACLVVFEGCVEKLEISALTSHLHESINSETLFLLWQFLTSAHDDECALYDIVRRVDG